MTPEGLQQLKNLYARELGTLGFKEIASGAHGWHVDAMFTNGRGGNFGFRLELAPPSDNPLEHHITIQANSRVPLAGEIPMDFRAPTPQEGVNYIRSIFLVAPGDVQYRPLPTQAPSRMAPGQPPRPAPVQGHQAQQRPQANPRPAPVQNPPQAPQAPQVQKGNADKVSRGNGGRFTKKNQA